MYFLEVHSHLRISKGVWDRHPLLQHAFDGVLGLFLPM
jgi:hypothetical protein